MQRLVHLAPSRADLHILQNLSLLEEISASDEPSTRLDDLIKVVENSHYKRCFTFWNRIIYLMRRSIPDGSSQNTPRSVITVQKALHLFPDTAWWREQLSTT